MLFVAALLCLAASQGHAHGMNPGQLVIRLAGDTVYVVTTPQSALFRDFDEDRDGRIGREELSARRDEILRFFESGFVITDPGGQRGEPIFVDLGVPHAHDGSPGGGHVRFTLRYRWDVAPAYLDVRYAYGARAPLAIRAQRLTPERRLTEQRPIGAAITSRFDAGVAYLRFFGG